MSITFRVYPQHNSVGARRNRAFMKYQAKQQRLMNKIALAQVVRTGAYVPGGNMYTPYAQTIPNYNQFSAYNTGIVPAWMRSGNLGYGSPFGYGLYSPYDYNNYNALTPFSNSAIYGQSYLTPMTSGSYQYPTQSVIQQNSVQQVN